MTQPYFIEYRRELSDKEIELLHFMLSDSNLNHYFRQVKSLKIIARCGCGKCPTILFGNSFKAEPITSASEITSYMGVAKNGTKVGVALLAKSGELTELEAWSICGGEFGNLPPLSSLINNT